MDISTGAEKIIFMNIATFTPMVIALTNTKTDNGSHGLFCLPTWFRPCYTNVGCTGGPGTAHIFSTVGEEIFAQTLTNFTYHHQLENVFFSGKCTSLLTRGGAGG